MVDAEQVQDAAEIYVYGYPLVYNLQEIAKGVAGDASLPMHAPYNQLASARQLLGPETQFVSPNNDTLYVVGHCDVRQGPLVLHVPDTNGRYYVLQFVDVWTNNFAYIGRRATGTAEAEYLLVHEGYEDEVPDGMRVLAAPTGVFTIVGRVQVNGEADAPAVHALQDQFTLTPLADRYRSSALAEMAGVPMPDPRVGDDLGWWERLRVALTAFPPPAGDGAYLARAERFGLTAAQSPYVNPDSALAEVLVPGQRAGQARIEELSEGAGPDGVNGWISAIHMFDYNLDRLGLGTIDAPEWKIPDRSRAYLTRALAARGGLWGNHGYEAAYVVVWIDDTGQPLEGSHRYELRLEQLPPVDAFWSLTMYDVPNFYLVANPIDRYSIGDRTAGLHMDPDGSLTIYLQADSPGPGKESNWLPTPAGAFRPMLRLYQPQQPVLDGTYALPAIRRVG